MTRVHVWSSGLVPDKEVRVSVKALAVSCVGAAAALHPEAFFNSLYLEPLVGIPAEGMFWIFVPTPSPASVTSAASDGLTPHPPNAEQQYISDVLGLIDHADPQIRGATAILCGAILQAALIKTRYNMHSWLAGVQRATGRAFSSPIMASPSLPLPMYK